MNGSITDPRDAKALAILAKIVGCVIDKPDKMWIEAKVRNGNVYFGVHASPRDVGILIGEQGQMRDAIQAVLKGIGKQSRRSYSVYFERNPSSDSSHKAPSEDSKPIADRHSGTTTEV